MNKDFFAFMDMWPFVITRVCMNKKCTNFDVLLKGTKLTECSYCNVGLWDKINAEEAKIVNYCLNLKLVKDYGEKGV